VLLDLKFHYFSVRWFFSLPPSSTPVLDLAVPSRDFSCSDSFFLLHSQFCCWIFLPPVLVRESQGVGDFVFAASVSGIGFPICCPFS
jgi:hypothetical protein